MPRKYSGILRTLHNPSIFRALVFKTLPYSEPEAYAEPWHIQNSGIFRTMGYSTRDKFRTLSNIYDGVLKLLTAIDVFANYNHFCNINFSRFYFLKFKSQLLAPKVFLLCKKNHSGPEGLGPWIFIYKEYLVIFFL